MSQPQHITESRRKTPLVLAVAGLIVLAALAICAVGAVNWPEAFWPGYLVSLSFWTSTSLGCLGIGLLHPLTGGRWGWGIGRELHASIGTVCVIGLAVVPLLFAARWVFPWATDSTRLNPHQQQYLAPEFVLVRTAGEWLLWSGLALWLIRAYRTTARKTDFRASPRVAAVGLILFWITVTSAAVDGLMSLDPTWTSSMFGAIQVLGCVVAGLSFVLVVRGFEPASVDDEHAQVTHDLGNLLMAFNLVWVYLSFSQYLITWSGDLPHEVAWYATRQQGLTGIVGSVLLGLHFVLPFALLLSATNKRDPRRLAAIAGLLLAMRVVDAGWTILPACSAAGPLSIVAVAASWCVLGAAWMAQFAWRMRRMPTINWERISVEATVPLAEPMEPMP